MPAMGSEKETRRARLLRRYHGIATLFWVLMVPVSILTGIWMKIEYVTFLSIWALVVSEWSAWQASRAETAQAERDGNDPAGHDGPHE